MRRINPHNLWIGSVRDAANITSSEIEFEAVVDLTYHEAPIVVLREICYCRFPLIDGPANPPWLLHTAVRTLASLIESESRTIVFCGLGLSRSPVVSAMALSLVTQKPPSECLEHIASFGRLDVNPGLWDSARAALGRQDRSRL